VKIVKLNYLILLRQNRPLKKRSYMSLVHDDHSYISVDLYNLYCRRISSTKWYQGNEFSYFHKGGIV
jgi:hypothetical protein